MWSNNLIQFARLISEIQATQDNLNIDALCASMDLTPLDISELFDRAVDVWHDAPANNDQAICLDLIQFARLLCEIAATQENFDSEPIVESMDIDPAELNELFDRAHEVWENAKLPDRMFGGE